MSMHEQSGHFSETLFFTHHQPPVSPVLREAFAIPMNGTTRTVIGGTAGSTANILMQEERGRE